MSTSPIYPPFQFQNTSPVDKNGNWTPEWKSIIENMCIFLSTIYTQQGVVVPGFKATDIAHLTNSLSGTLVYDTTNNLFKANQNGTFKTITTT